MRPHRTRRGFLGVTPTLAFLALMVSHSQDLARQHWHTDPCGGQVTIAYRAMPPIRNAESVYTTTDGNPASFGDCSITFNSAESWTWPRFCTVMVHEYGHLAGHDHSSDPADVMFPTLVRIAPECALGT